jgi:hypothetical protein
MRSVFVARRPCRTLRPHPEEPARSSGVSKDGHTLPAPGRQTQKIGGARRSSPPSPLRHHDHSSGTPVARRLQQPTRTAGSGHRSRFLRLRADPAPPLFGLAPGGVYRAAAVAGNAVRSYRTFSPLPRPNATHRGGLILCGTVPRLAPAGRYPAPYVHGARTFLPHRLSALMRAAVRPTDT